jgi:putative acetyltransferase
MQIRIAEERDAAAIAQGEWDTAATPGMLVGRPGEIPVSAFVTKIAELSSRGCYWVAEESDAVIGHAFLDPMKMAGNSHVYHLNIVVHPGHTARGVGTALMRHLMTWAKDRAEVGKVELLVRASNTRAVALYRKFGFVDEGRLRARVRTPDGRFLDDLAMAWYPNRGDVQSPVED